MSRPITPLPGFNVRPLARLEFRNDHRGECTCFACVMERDLGLKKRELSAKRLVREVQP